MPDIHFGGDLFNVDVEPDPWEPQLTPECEALVGRPLPEINLPITETPNRSIPLHQLGRGRSLVVFIPAIGTAKAPVDPDIAELPQVITGLEVQMSVHQQFENLMSMGFFYLFLISTQSIEELRKIVLPPPRQQFPGVSDPELTTADLLGLPTFTHNGKRYFEPVSLFVTDGAVEKVNYPIKDPANHARWAFNWARTRRPDLDFLNYNMDRGTFTPKDRGGFIPHN